MLDASEALEVMRRGLFCILEVAESEFCLLKVPEMISCMLLVCRRCRSIYAMFCSVYRRLRMVG